MVIQFVSNFFSIVEIKVIGFWLVLESMGFLLGLFFIGMQFV